MTIEITRPEVEALIRQRLSTGRFADPQDMILDALRTSHDTRRMGTELVAAMQASPAQELDIEPDRGPMPIRGVDF